MCKSMKVLAPSALGKYSTLTLDIENLGRFLCLPRVTPVPFAYFLCRRMYNSGHQVASHTWSHPDLCNITSAQRRNEMYKNEMALRNILGVIPTYMRPPYSSCTAGKAPVLTSIESRTDLLACGCEADLLDLGYHIT